MDTEQEIKDLKDDLRNYYKYMLNTEERLDDLIELEEKYGMFGGTPEMFCTELQGLIEQAKLEEKTGE